MTTEKKPRNMTPNGFLSKAVNAKSALAFLEAHRDYMLTGEIAKVTSPILKKVDEKELLPSPALAEIRTAVMNHIMISAINSARNSAEKAQASGSPDKPYLANVYDADGKIVEVKNAEGELVELSKAFALPQEAERWCDRRLEECASDCRGEVIATHMNMMVSHISRVEALGRLLKQRGGSTGGKAPSGNLSWGVKAKPSKSTFSHG